MRKSNRRVFLCDLVTVVLYIFASCQVRHRDTTQAHHAGEEADRKCPKKMSLSWLNCPQISIGISELEPQIQYCLELFC